VPQSCVTGFANYGHNKPPNKGDSRRSVKAAESMENPLAQTPATVDIRLLQNEALSRR